MIAIIKSGFLEVYDITIVRIIVFKTVIKVITINTFIIILKRLIYRVITASQR